MNIAYICVCAGGPVDQGTKVMSIPPLAQDEGAREEGGTKDIEYARALSACSRRAALSGRGRR